jgi:hypothetical protein
MRYSSMSFRVTRHGAMTPPDHAMSLLSERLPKRREDVCFSKVGEEIGARLDRDESVSVTRDERVEIGRRAVLNTLAEICERAPELKLDWYAVSPAS